MQQPRKCIMYIVLHVYAMYTYIQSFNILPTSLSQSQSAANPGRVKCMEVCPADPNFLLIGYDKGVVSLWSVNRGLPTKNFPASIQDCQQVHVHVSLLGGRKGKEEEGGRERGRGRGRERKRERERKGERGRERLSILLPSTAPGISLLAKRRCQVCQLTL